MEPRTYTGEYRELVALVNAQGDALKKCQQERDDAQASLEIRELTIERLTHEREQALAERDALIEERDDAEAERKEAG